MSRIDPENVEKHVMLALIEAIHLREVKLQEAEGDVLILQGEMRNACDALHKLKESLNMRQADTLILIMNDMMSAVESTEAK